METNGVHNISSSKTEVIIGNARIQDEKGIVEKVTSAFYLILEITFLFIKCLIADVESIYRMLVPKERKDVSQELVLITGTGHGIGRELALQYSALGSRVVCVDINKENNDQTVKLVKQQGGKAFAYVCDVASREKVFKLAEQIRAEVGEVSVLVNNAGIMPCHSLMTHREDEVKKLFDINVFAHIWLFQAFVPSMISRNHGHIVAMSSMAGVMGVPNLVPYCGSKYAVRGMMEAFHEELRADPRGLAIKFTSIYPYIVDTGLCHKPRIRFPNLMKMVKPQEAAAAIIDAMRKEDVEASIPKSLLKMNQIFRLGPYKVALHVKDFLDSGVDSHE